MHRVRTISRSSSGRRVIEAAPGLLASSLCRMPVLVTWPATNSPPEDGQEQADCSKSGKKGGSPAPVKISRGKLPGGINKPNKQHVNQHPLLSDVVDAVVTGVHWLGCLVVAIIVPVQSCCCCHRPLLSGLVLSVQVTFGALPSTLGKALVGSRSGVGSSVRQVREIDHCFLVVVLGWMARWRKAPNQIP